MVAPIFNDKSIAEYYLPQGRWTDYFTGKEVLGGTWMQEQVDYLTISLFVKENTLLALGARDERPDYDYEQNVQIALYALGDGVKAQTVVYGMDAKTKLSCSATRSGNQLLLELTPESSPNPTSDLTQQYLSCQLKMSYGRGSCYGRQHNRIVKVECATCVNIRSNQCFGMQTTLSCRFATHRWSISLLARGLSISYYCRD